MIQSKKHFHDQRPLSLLHATKERTSLPSHLFANTRETTDLGKQARAAFLFNSVVMSSARGGSRSLRSIIVHCKRRFRRQSKAIRMGNHVSTSSDDEGGDIEEASSPVEIFFPHPHPVSLMSSFTHGDDLPLVKMEAMLDWEEDFVVMCQKCPGKSIPLKILQQHKNWHVRTNLLLHLQNLVRNSETKVPFGSNSPGCLVRMNYECKDEKLRGNEVEKATLLKYLRRCWTFVTLKYQEGLKYTFGNKFVSRQSQGEFIILSVNPVMDATTEENYFHLECREGCLWISKVKEDASPSTVVSVNGEPLGISCHEEVGDKCNVESEESVSNLPSELKHEHPIIFGDIISISVDDGRKGRRFCDFIFEEEIKVVDRDQGRKAYLGDGYDSSESCEEMDVAVVKEAEEEFKGPLQNPLILQNVLSFLSTKVLKKLRIACQLWDIEALKLIKDRVEVKVIKTSPYLHGPAEADFLLQVNDYALSPLNQLKFSKWKIVLPEPSDEWHCPLEVQIKGKKTVRRYQARMKKIRENKMLQDMEWLFGSDFQHNVKTLEIRGGVGSVQSMTTYQVLLSEVGQTLTTLYLNLVIEEKSPLPTFPFVHMGGLKNLTLSFGGCSTSANWVSTFIQGFLPAVLNTQSLTLANSSVDTDEGMLRSQYAATVLKKIAQLQAEDAKKFNSLTSITIEQSSGDQIAPLRSLRTGSLKNLQLHHVPPQFSFIGQRNNASDVWYPVLTTHADFLENVTLYFKVSRKLSIAFPAAGMKNLKTLSIFCYMEDKWDRADVEFKFGEAASDTVTRIDYKRYFPSLSKLTIWPVFSTAPDRHGNPSKNGHAASWSQFVRILEAFTQSVYDEEEDENIPVRSIESLDIPFLLKDKYHWILDDLEETFPNVTFPPVLEEARAEVTSRAKLRDSDDDEDTEEERDSSEEDEGGFGFGGGGFGGWRRTSEVEAEKRQKEKKRLAREEQRLNAPLNLFG